MIPRYIVNSLANCFHCTMSINNSAMLTLMQYTIRCYSVAYLCLIKFCPPESTVDEERLKEQEKAERTRIQKEHELKVRSMSAGKLLYLSGSVQGLESLEKP